MSATPLQRFAATRPRLSGLAGMLMGLGFVGFNLWSAESRGRFYSGFFLVGFACFFVGFFVLVTGRTEPPASLGLPQPPLWWRVGAIVLVLLGVGLGVYVSEMLKR